MTKNHTKIAAALLAALCLILLLPACTAESRPDRQPVKALECTRPEALSALCPVGSGLTAAVWADYENESTTIRLVDAERDAVRQETTLDGVWDMKKQSFNDGRLALLDRENCCWRFLSSDLRPMGDEFTAENVDGFFSYDGGDYYFLRDHVLFRRSLASGQTARVSLSSDLRILDITAFDAPSGRMVVQFMLSPYNTECGTALLDVTTGQVSMLRQERYQAAFTGDGLCLLSFDANAMGYSALYGSGDLFYFADASLFLDAGGDLYAISGAPYLMGVTTGRSVLYAAGEQITECSLAANGISGEMYDCCWLPDAQLLVGAVYESGAFRLYAMDPARLSFTQVADAAPVPSPLTVDETLLRDYWGALSGLPLPEDLQAARQSADALEAAYGVRILLSSQCREAAALGSYTMTLSDTMDSAAELEGIRTMLEAMDHAFALYPDGFLSQFRNSAGEGGLCFLLVAHIDSDYGVVGCAYEGADWQYIALDVQSAYMREGTVCHEIWHATENKILSRDYTAFDYDGWAALNPEGFTYYGDATLQDPAQPWTLYSSPIEDVHFVDTYACVAAGEDRARIMEFFMTYDEDARQLIRSPYIRRKLQWMSDAVRSTFDTTGWGTPRWETLL